MVAEIVAVVFVVTAKDFTVNVADVLPAAIVAVLGTVAALESLFSETFNPPAGAADVIVTVPMLVFPPFTEVGLRVTAVNVGAVIVSIAVWLWSLKVAEIVAVFCAATANDLTVNVADVLPDATVTEEGTVAEVVLLDSLTAIPPAGAVRLSETVPVELVPPATVVGLRLNDARLGGVTVRLAAFETDPAFAVIVAIF